MLFFLNNSFAQKWQWVEKIGLSGSGNNHAYDLVLDSESNIFVVGRVKNSATFGSGSNAVSPAFYGDRDIFVAKYDKNGNLKWANRSGSASAEWANGIAVDKKGNCYATGVFRSNCAFGSTVVNAIGNSDAFVIKYDSLGNIVWLKQAGGSSAGVTAESVAVDSLGNVYITGKFSYTVSFDTIVLTSNSNSADIFLAKYDSLGNCLWVQQYGGSGDDTGNAIKIDLNGNVIFTGHFSGTATFDITALSSFGGWDIFLSKINSDGVLQWVKNIGGSGTDEGYELECDLFNNYYLTGYVGSRMHFSKHNSSGIQIWNKSFTGTGTSRGLGISIDKSGSSFITGYFNGPTAFDTNISYSPMGTQDIFVAKYDSSSSLVWFKHVQNTIIAGIIPTGAAISVDTLGFAYVTGDFLSTASFDTISRTASGTSSDVFIGKISPYFKAEVSVNSQTFCAGANISFSGPQPKAYSSEFSWQWSFPGGVPNSSNVSNPIVQYNSIGNYDVTLIAYNGFEYDTLSLANFITISSAPVVSLGNDTSLCQGASIELTTDPVFQEYLWSDGSTSSSLTVTSQGEYYVVVDGSGCAGSDTVNITIDVCLDIAELGTKETISVFPNPFTNHVSFVVNLTLESNPELSIYDMYGKLHLKSTIKNTIENVNTDFLPTGIYFYRISVSESEGYSGKIIKR
ncbi:MAG: SBBP repeat-containing protein [Bacteroidetes bacterium]|nr:SBBP repeat-containing protein [Bacteroidota bacterium]HET6244691.1 SBBP repeat-containing protein [Bacteroidia bacterium]